MQGNYDDGTVADIPSGYQFANVDNSAIGIQAVKAGYRGLETSFDILYKQPALTKLEVVSMPTVTTFYYGDKVDYSGLKVDATDEDGNIYHVEKECSLSGFDNTTVGKQTITVTYAELSTTFTIRVRYPFTYTTSNEEITVAGKVSSANVSKIVIPETIDSAKVVSIASNAFKDNTVLTTVELPESITSIGSYAFYGCTKLASVNIPEKVTAIASYTFYNCAALKKVVIPDGVTSIGERAFYSCSRMTSLTMPCSASVYYNSTKKDTSSFYGCSGITDLHLTKGTGSMKTYSPDGYYALPWTNSSKLTKVTLDEGIKNISEYFFYLCYGLTKVKLPSTVTSIGKYAFYECTKLEEVNIPEKVTSIEEYTFYHCICLTAMELPESVTSIGRYAFYDCTKLASINLPEKVTAIANYSFYYCSALKKVVIPDGVTSMGECAFYRCSGLTSLTMPCSASVYYNSTKKDTSSFYGCSGITDLHLTKGTGSMKTYSPDGYYALPWTNGAKLTKVTLDEGIKNIGTYFFYGCSGLKEVKLPSTVTALEDYCFCGASGLKSMELPSTVTSIGIRVFYNCSALEKIYLSDNIDTIGSNMFLGCNKLILYANKGTPIYNWATKNDYTCYSTASVSLSQTKLTMYKDGVATITAAAIMLNGKEDTGADIVWTTSNEEVVSVKNGVIRVSGPGIAQVTASYEGQEAVCEVEVLFPIESISFAQEEMDIDIGNTEQVTVLFNPYNTSDKRVLHVLKDNSRTHNYLSIQPAYL